MSNTTTPPQAQSLFAKVLQLAAKYGATRFGPRRSSIKRAAKETGTQAFFKYKARRRNYSLAYHPANRGLTMRERQNKGLLFS